MTTAVLLLNADYTPIKVIPWERAVCLLLDEKVRIVTGYTGKVIRSASAVMEWPAVVALVKYATVANKVRFNRSNLLARDGYTCQYCLHPDHKILTADLRWVPAGSLSEGDTLVGFDEHQDGHSRRGYRASTILNYKQEEQELFKVVLDSGKEFHVTKDHKWLCRTEKGPYHWRETVNLAGLYVVKHFEVWNEDPSRDAGWLAGMFDGEGWLRMRNGISVAIAQRPGPVLDKLKNGLTERGFEYSELVVNRTQDCVRLHIKGGGSEAVRLLGSIRPVRLLSQFDPGRLGVLRALESNRVVSVESVGVGPIVKMRTSTATFIADGYLHHNCGIAPKTASGAPDIEGLTLDHVVPRAQSKYGEVVLPWNKKRVGVTSWDNVVCACAGCNAAKADRTPVEAGMKLRSIPHRPTPFDSVRMALTKMRVPEEWREWLPSDSPWRDYWDTELDAD